MSITGGKIPESVIQEVLKHHDIAETVGRYVHLSKEGKYLKGLCPFHSEKTPSFTVTPEKQIFYCYGCGQGGDVIKFVAQIEGLSFPEAVSQMAEQAGLEVAWQQQSGVQSPEQQNRQILLEAHLYTAKFYHYLLNNTEFGRPAKTYLKERGLTDKLIEQFMIGYAPDRWDTLLHFLSKRAYDLQLMERGGLLSAKSDGSGYVDRFRNRIMFPLWDKDGKVIAFAGRVLGEGQPKYLNSPETALFNKSKSLYHFHGARSEIRKQGKAVLFEGYMDVIKAWSAGVKHGIATMGTALTEAHAMLLRRSCEEVVICYDGDAAGQAAALKSMPILEKARLSASVAVLPQGMDPDEYVVHHGAEAFVKEIIGQPVSVMKFRLIYLRKHHTLVEEEGRKNYVLEAVRLIAELESPIEREFYLKELSREFEMPLEALKQDCHQIREQAYNLRATRDNKPQAWNNGMNEKRRSPALAQNQVKPAYLKAEQYLLLMMMQDATVASQVHALLGDAFVTEDHAALAAYLYAYYEEGNMPDVGRFLTRLQDDRLERIAAALLVSAHEAPPFHSELMNRHVGVIQKQHKRRQLEERREEQLSAERAGNPLLAARIASEIIALERQLKDEL